MRQGLFCLLLVPLLFGCTSIPLGSISKLSALRPDTAALEEYQVAVRVPEDYRLYGDGATIKVRVESSALEQDKALDLVLIPSTAELTTFLLKREKRGYRIVMFEVDAKDTAEIQKFRAEILSIFEEYPGQNTFTTTAWAKGCLVQGANPFQDLHMALYLRPKPDEGFFTLFKGTKIGTIKEAADGTVCTDQDEANLL